jgi:hypothetical protein
MDVTTFRQLVEAQDRAALERARKRVPVARVGDVVMCRSAYALVLNVRHYAPGRGRPRACPIKEHMVAMVWVTTNGDRWWGTTV